MIRVEISEQDLKELIVEAIKTRLGSAGYELTPQQVQIEVKSKQNYKSEWEVAAFRAVCTVQFIGGK